MEDNKDNATTPLLPIANNPAVDLKQFGAPLAPLLKQHMGVRTQIKAAPMPGKFTLSSLVLTMAASQSLFGTVAAFVFWIFGSILTPLIWPLWWLPLAAGGVYILCFLIIWRFKKRLRVSSSCILFVATLMFSEAVIVAFIAMFWQAELVALLLALYAVSMYSCAMYSQLALGHYRYNGGRAVALFILIGFFVLMAIFLDKWILIPMCICGAVVAIYEFFIIEKIARLVEKHEGEEKFLDAVFYNLMVYKQKISWFLIVFTIWVRVYKACNKKPLHENTESTAVTTSGASVTKSV